MTIYRGQLKRIGDGTWKSGVTTASVVEIGERALRHMMYSDFLKTYLMDGLNENTEIAISLDYYNEIKVIRIGNRVYNDSTPSKEIALGIFIFLLGIPFLALLLIGFVGLIIGSRMIISGLTWSADWAELRNA